MKRKIILSGALLVVLVTVAACSSQQNAAGSSASATAAFASGMRRPDFGQPKTAPNIRGVVTSVVGNQVTVLKIALNPGRRASSTAAVSGSGTSSTPNTPSISLGASGGPRGGFYGGPRGGGSTGTTDRAAMIANLEKTSTGSETITVPVGIKMMKNSIDPNTQKRTMVEATLNDIVSDSMITVWLNPASASSSPVADFVLINN